MLDSVAVTENMNLKNACATENGFSVLFTNTTLNKSVSPSPNRLRLPNTLIQQVPSSVTSSNEDGGHLAHW